MAPRCKASRRRWQELNFFERCEDKGFSVCKLCKHRVKSIHADGLRKHLQRVHNCKSGIWKYFDSVTYEDVAVCKGCKQRVRKDQSLDMIQHIQKSHNIFITDTDNSPVEKRDNKCISKVSQIDLTKNEVSTMTVIDSSDDSVNEDLSAKVVNIKELNVNNIVVTPNVKASALKPESSSLDCFEGISQNTKQVKSKRKNPKKWQRRKWWKRHIDIQMYEKTLMSAMWGLMVHEGVTPLVIASKNMQALINPICEAISIQEKKDFKIDMAASEKFLCSYAQDLQVEFSKELNLRLLSLKIDIDLKGPFNIHCISACFVDEGRVQKRILGVIDLKDEPQLTEQHIVRVLHKFNIDINQIISAYWDDTKPKYNTLVKNSEYLRTIKTFEKHPDLQIGNVKIERFLGAKAQLCLLDIFKNFEIYQLFLECRNLTLFICKNPKRFYDTFEENNLRIPQLDSPWRWGSTYKMMFDLKEARSVLENKDYPQLEHLEDRFNVNETLWLFIEGFCESLSFMQKTIAKYYTEEMHFGDYYVQWLKSKLLTAKLVKSNKISNHFITMISTELLKCIEARSKEILSTDSFAACLYMDPRFQHTLVLQVKAKALDYLKKIWNRSKMYNPDVNKEHSKKPNESTDFNEEDAILNEFLCQDVHQIDQRTREVYNKIECLKLKFKPVDTNILYFWNQQKLSDPEMYALSAICFAIPTTQKYNENFYAHIYRSNAISKLSSFTRENLLIVHLNSDLIRDVPEYFKIIYDDKSPEEELLKEVKKGDNSNAAIKISN